MDKCSAAEYSVTEVIFTSIPMRKTFARNNPTSTHPVIFALIQLPVTIYKCFHHRKGGLASSLKKC